MQLVDLAVGSLVKDPNTTYNGDPIIWRVLEHGHTGDPSGSTALEARDIITCKCFDAKEPNNSNSGRQLYGNSRYLYSNILQWLNSDAAAGQWYTAQHNADEAPDSSHVWVSETFINPYDTEAGFLTNFSNGLKTVLMEVSKTTGKANADGGGSESVSSKIFLLSTTEVGLANESVAEGSIYAYYSASNTNARRIKNLANDATKGNYSYATSPWMWWLRTAIYSSNSYRVIRVGSDGTNGNNDAYRGAFGVSPALCIPANTEVSSEPGSDGVYELFLSTTPSTKLYVPYNGITTLPKKIYVGVGGIATPVSKIYTGINGEAVKIYDAGGASGGGIYGAEWDGSSVTTWTRTDDAANFPDPNPYYAGMSGTPSSPFDNISPWAGMVRSTDSSAGELVAIPKFYYKLEQVGTLGMKIQISSTPQTGFVTSPAHMDRGDGKGERDYVYVGRYHCASDYRSMNGGKPVANITRSAARSSIHNLGSDYYQWDFATRFTIWLLYLVEFADWNSQAKIGYGCGNNSATENMGYTDSMTYHTGTKLSSRTTYGLGTQYRYIEGLWDNVYDYLDGCYYNSSGLNLILNPASFSDSSGGTSIGTPSSGYPSKFTVSNAAGFPAFYPSEAKGGSNSTFSCDSWGFVASNPCLCVGGYYSQNLGRGLFCVGHSSASDSVAGRGCRLMKLP